MKALTGFALGCACACTEPRVPDPSVPPEQAPLPQAPAPATSVHEASATPVPGMPAWLAGKLPPNRIPFADHTFRDIPDSPQVAVTQQQILVDGEVVGMTQELQRAGRLKRVDPLFQYMKDLRQRMKEAEPDVPFPGVATFWIDIETSALVVKSVFQTVGFAGFPNGRFAVRDRDGTGFKSLPADARIPRPGRLAPEVIQSVVRSNYAKVRECYEAGLARTPELHGSIEIRFVIDSEGMVHKPTLESSTLPDDQVNQCVVAVFSSLEFPKPNGDFVNVVYPLKFELGEAAP